MPTETVPVCSREGCTNPRADTDSNNPWCKEHRAEYQRQYERGRLDRKERHGFVLGVEALRDLLCEEFDKLGFSQFAAFEIRDLIRGTPGPKLPGD